MATNEEEEEDISSFWKAGRNTMGAGGVKEGQTKEVHGSGGGNATQNGCKI